MASPAIQYTARDFASNLAALQDYVRANAPENWNSFFAGDLGEVLAELIAYDGAQLSFIGDMAALNCFPGTLKHREALIHLCHLVGYRLRRSSTVSLACYARAATSPSPSDHGYIIPKGVQATGRDGSIWEVASDCIIAPGNTTPLRIELQYGDVIAPQLRAGQTVQVVALVKLTVGSATATLCHPDGTRLNEATFGPRVSAGSILRMTQEVLTWSSTVTTWGGAPQPPRGEYAVIEAGKLTSDLQNYTVLYLDRPWDGATDFVGQWVIENRNIIMSQGESRQDVLTLPAGTNRPGYQATTSFYPVISGDVEPFIPSGQLSTVNGVQLGAIVTVNGVAWQAVANLLACTSDQQVYEFDFDALDRMTVTFGDGQFGALLPEEAQIAISYRTGGGASGNVLQNAIDTTIIGQVASQTSTPVTISISNPFTVGKGGSERESISEARTGLPAFVRANDRAVSPEDYISLASGFSDPAAGRIRLAKGVLHRNAVPHEQNIVWLYAWVSGPSGQLASPSYDLKQRLLDYMNERKMMTDEVVVLDGTVATTPIQLRIRMVTGSFPSDVLYQVQNAINAVFADLQPGATLYISRLYDACMEVTGVQYCDWLLPSTDAVPTTEFEVVTNSLQLPVYLTMTATGLLGDNHLTVSDTSSVGPGTRISIFQYGVQPTTAIVESVTATVITLRTPLLATYAMTATLIIGDFLPLIWQYERPVQLYVTFSSDPAATAVATAGIKFQLSRWFAQSLRPEQALRRTDLLAVVAGVPDVLTCDVKIGSSTSVLESVTPGSYELVTLGGLVVNGVII